ncbi:prephenate dehydrogenase [Salinactinospora qingdaonensis]|uniref:Prephenate/arogenate dehydrogenase domain-containing protein n=1 Tax=Salinactinospora qingdaonensis TaxID=702744 RepID=A0ABP7EUM9_9ACTN
MIGRCVVIGGGAVGKLFAERLHNTGARVRVFDRAAQERSAGTGVPQEHGDVTAIDPAMAAELGQADLVVLAVPEPVAIAAVPGLLAALPAGSLLVDTLSVKQPIAAAVESAAPGAKDVEVVSVNPMFAPALGFENRPVAAVALREGPRSQEMLGLIESWGGGVVRMSAEQHDRLSSATQALTHATVLAFGTALTELGVDAEELRAVAPPPHATLLALLARIVSGAPEVYWDVQSANPEAARAREALAEGARRIDTAVQDGGEADFTNALAAVRSFLGDDLPAHGERCARLFALI